MKTLIRESNPHSSMRPGFGEDCRVEPILCAVGPPGLGDGSMLGIDGCPFAGPRPPTDGCLAPPEGIADELSGDGKAPGVVRRLASCLAEGVLGLLGFLALFLLGSWFNGIAPLLAIHLLKLDHPVVSGILVAMPFAMLILTAAVVALARSPIRRGEVADSVDLDAYEVAALSGGPEFATNTALASLVSRGLLVLDAEERRLFLRADQPIVAHPLEDAIRSAIDPESGGDLDAARSAARPVVGRIREGLIRRGLIMSEGRSGAVDCMMLLDIFLGMPGCWAVGFWTGYPLAMVPSFVVVIMAQCMAAVAVGRTRDGDAMLDDLKGRFAIDAPGPGPDEEPGPGDRIVLSLALLDRTALPEGELAELWGVLDPSGADGDPDASGESDGGGADGGGD